MKLVNLLVGLVKVLPSGPTTAFIILLVKHVNLVKLLKPVRVAHFLLMQIVELVGLAKVLPSGPTTAFLILSYETSKFGERIESRTNSETSEATGGTGLPLPSCIFF